VRTKNARAHGLYRRFGFAPVGIRKNYYEGTEDALIMWVHDIATPEYRAVLDNAVAGLDPPFEVLDPKPWATAVPA
jgi:ribosomal-protein-alanine N-acetyltransferase